jgi:hypothetical protein
MRRSLLTCACTSSAAVDGGWCPHSVSMIVSRRTSSPGWSASCISTVARCGGPSSKGRPSRHAASGPSTASHSPLPCPAGAPVPAGARRAGRVARAADPRVADCPASRPSARASASSDPGRGRYRRPCSRSRTAATLSPDRSANCRCVSPAARRNSRTMAPSRAPDVSRRPSMATSIVPFRHKAVLRFSVHQLLLFSRSAEQVLRVPACR